MLLFQDWTSQSRWYSRPHSYCYPGRIPGHLSRRINTSYYNAAAVSDFYYFAGYISDLSQSILFLNEWINVALYCYYAIHE
jgi:hypothetical protein